MYARLGTRHPKRFNIPGSAVIESEAGASNEFPTMIVARGETQRRRGQSSINFKT